MRNSVIHGECLEEMAALPDASVDMILCDPPYFGVMKNDWDNQWEDVKGFVKWVGLMCVQWKRILKRNGSLYVFAYPSHAANVEVSICEYFRILNRIAWVKPSGYHRKCSKDSLRAYFPQKEEIIFAEQYHAEQIDEKATYRTVLDGVWAFVFEPLRKYMVDELAAAGMTQQDANKACGTASMARHYFQKSQWELPTEEKYFALRRYANDRNRNAFQREYEDLRREYEDLRREYEDLRRPFNIGQNDGKTDCWSFPNVPFRAGKHPCEKPLAMFEQIIKTSSRPGALVLDNCAGSGTTAIACLNTGRDYLLIEKEQKYIDIINNRIANHAVQCEMDIRA